MKIPLLLLVFTIFYCNLYSSWQPKYGIIIEVDALNTYRYKATEKKNINSFEKNALNLFFKAELPASEKTSFDLRLGYLIDNLYTGPELGGFFRSNLFNDNFFVAVGANILINLGFSASVAIIDPGFHFNPGLMLGYKLNKNASLVFNFCKPLNNNFGADRDQPGDPVINLNYILGGGLEINF